MAVIAYTDADATYKPLPHLGIVPVAGCVGVSGDAVDAYRAAEGVLPVQKAFHHGVVVDYSGGAAVDDLWFGVA
jgi:hypothetical protein